MRNEYRAYESSSNDENINLSSLIKFSKGRVADIFQIILHVPGHIPEMRLKETYEFNLLA